MRYDFVVKELPALVEAGDQQNWRRRTSIHGCGSKLSTLYYIVG